MKMMRRREQGYGPAYPAWLGRGGGVRKGVGRGVWRRERGKMNSKRVLLNPPNPTFNKEVSQTPFSFLASAPLVCSRQESRDHPRKNHRQASRPPRKQERETRGLETHRKQERHTRKTFHRSLWTRESTRQRAGEATVRNRGTDKVRGTRVES